MDTALDGATLDSITATVQFTLRDSETPIAKVHQPGAGPDDGTARWTAHGSFQPPNLPADTPPRESIEIRSMYFYD